MSKGALKSDFLELIVPVVGAGLTVTVFGISANMKFRFLGFLIMAALAVALFFLFRFARSAVERRRARNSGEE